MINIHAYISEVIEKIISIKTSIIDYIKDIELVKSRLSD